jgi:hypothetical protein
VTGIAFHLQQVLSQGSAPLWWALFQRCRCGGASAQDEAKLLQLQGKALAQALHDQLDLVGCDQPNLVTALVSEVQRIHAMATREGIHALRNVSPTTHALHDEFAQLTGDTERSVWAHVHAPDVFALAELAVHTDQRLGKRGWQRLQIPACEQVFSDISDINALEKSLSTLFTKRGQTPRVCEIDIFERHLDGGLQLRIFIEDDVQRNLEFGEDDRTHWRTVRPPISVDLIYIRSTGVVDVIATGGSKLRDQLVCTFGQHVLRQSVTPRSIVTPRFLLNRLKKGLALPSHDALTQLHPSAIAIRSVRLLSAKFRAIAQPALDVDFKASPEVTVPDVLANLQQRSLATPFLATGFDIIAAVVTVSFVGANGLPGRKPLHIELRPTGIANLREMSESDQALAQGLLVYWGVMEPALADAASNAKEEAVPV